jgi:hypothetical protein
MPTQQVRSLNECVQTVPAVVIVMVHYSSNEQYHHLHNYERHLGLERDHPFRDVEQVTTYF